MRGLSDRLGIAAEFQFAESNALHVAQQCEWREILRAQRLGVDHFRHGDQTAEELKQVHLFLAKCGIVLVDPQDDWLGHSVDTQLEIRVPKAIREGLDVESATVRKRGLNHPVQQMRRQGAARFGMDRAGRLGGGRKHMAYDRALEADNMVTGNAVTVRCGPPSLPSAPTSPAPLPRSVPGTSFSLLGPPVYQARACFRLFLDYREITGTRSASCGMPH